MVVKSCFWGWGTTFVIGMRCFVDMCYCIMCVVGWHLNLLKSHVKFWNTLNLYYSWILLLLFVGIFNTGFTSPDIAKLRDCISVLFMFERRPVEDKEFKADCRQWLDMLVSPHTTTPYIEIYYTETTQYEIMYFDNPTTSLIELEILTKLNTVWLVIFMGLILQGLGSSDDFVGLIFVA